MVHNTAMREAMGLAKAENLIMCCTCTSFSSWLQNNCHKLNLAGQPRCTTATLCTIMSSTRLRNADSIAILGKSLTQRFATSSFIDSLLTYLYPASPIGNCCMQHWWHRIRLTACPAESWTTRSAVEGRAGLALWHLMKCVQGSTCLNVVTL